MSSPHNKSRKELLKLLRGKIGEKQINRKSKQNKEVILNKTLKSMDIDSKKLKEDLEKVNKENGFSFNINDTIQQT